MERAGHWLCIAIVGLVLCRIEALPSESVKISYHGIIGENAKSGTEVELDQPLYARNMNNIDGDEVCGYTLYKSMSQVPFKVVLVDRKRGGAKIVLASGYGLDYEKQNMYTFEIAAHGCISGAHSPREEVTVEVEDVNEFSPQWQQDTYIAEVQEGRMYEQIVQLQAADHDGSPDYSRICHYNILTPDAPFTIDSHGYLKNTEPLLFSQHHNFILEVKAEDCGGLQSDKIMVNIRITQACSSGWTGVDTPIEYLPGSGVQLVADQATLSLCDTTCLPASYEAKLKLETEHIGKGCDRDTYAIENQRRLCGASSSSVDLLPNPAVSSLTKHLPTDDGHEADQIFYFDGKTASIEVPKETFEPHLSRKFTISTWMKHEENTEDDAEKGTKEHILCHADAQKMNRHHYSLFIHNCKLILLQRQEAEEGTDMNTFKPAEWRWKLPQVCDGEWHHYAVNMNFPEVHLYLDGKVFVPHEKDPAVVDDWPLHKTKFHDTKFFVGACWHGGEQHVSQFFRGYLAGLSVLNNAQESEQVIECLTSCQEKLDFHAMSEMETGMTISMNSEMTDITLTGTNKSSVEHLLHRVGYLNARMFPTPGHRTVHLTTDVTCVDGQHISIPPVARQLMVAAAENQIISVSGSKIRSVEEEQFMHGVKVFADVTIDSHTRKELDEMDLMTVDDLDKSRSNDRYLLDLCKITVSPALDSRVEKFDVPMKTMQKYNLAASYTPDALVIAGLAHTAAYEEVIRLVHYYNGEPEGMNRREFVLSCQELNGRFVSEELSVVLEVLHKKHDEAIPVAHAQESKLVQPVNNFKSELYESIKSGGGLTEKSGGNGTGAGMIMIIVVCVGFLCFMIVLGVIRIRSSHQRTRAEVTVEDKPEMEWDNSALTITVNPMDQEIMYEEEQEMNGLRAEDTESEEDELDTDRDDGDSSEEEVEKTAVKGRDLEWDDSTITF